MGSAPGSCPPLWVSLNGFWLYCFQCKCQGLLPTHLLWNLHSVSHSRFPLRTSPMDSCRGLRLVSMCRVYLCLYHTTCNNQVIFLKWKSHQATDLAEIASELSFPERWQWNCQCTNDHHSLPQTYRSEQKGTTSQESGHKHEASKSPCYNIKMCITLSKRAHYHK